MKQKMYAQIEYLGSPKPCRIEPAVSFGNRCLVSIKRGALPAIYLSGNRQLLAAELEKVVNRLRGHS
jgi:hypothetical protein